ncbi:ATP-dependent protease [Desulfosporosinus sp. Tol-M]|nr:ATP-dependent protease [Desulfosporosinus sp. Tol-M]
MENTNKFRIPVEKLRKVCDYNNELDFCKTSLDVPPREGVIGQDRAVHSMEFGLDMDTQGYNIFVVGPTGTGKSTYVQTIVSKIADKGPTPSDWCYINNFSDPDRPLAISLPAGQGRWFQKDMDELVTDLTAAITKVFEGNDFEQQKDAIIQAVQQKMEEKFHIAEQESLEAGFVVRRTPQGLQIIPIKDEKPLNPEEYNKLSDEEQRAFEKKAHKLQKRLDETYIHEGRLSEKQVNEQTAELEKKIGLGAASHLVGKLKEKYSKFTKITEYLDEVLKDVIENLGIFRGSITPSPLPFPMPQDEVDPFTRYKVNLFVNNEKTGGLPAIFELSCNYYNLFGKIEYKSAMFALNTNFTMAKAGALQRANGGYLVLQAKDVLTDQFAWDTLKRALKYQQAVVENIGEQYRFVSTIKPEPIPLKVKIILIGSPLFYSYFTLDEDFQKLFKVKVDFDIEMPRTQGNLHQYVSFVSEICRQENLRHFSRDGLAKVIEYGSILARDQNKLSTRFSEVSEIVYEAAALADNNGSEHVGAKHVDKAIQERKYRSNRLEGKIQEMILQGKILIDTKGNIVGQVNGLAVLGMGNYMFGMPTRITARTYAGRGGIINIERETDMSGNIHSKGVLTLAGYLGGKFAQERPLGLTAQITFEQNYEGVDGDSASSTELYAILSSLTGLPLKQNLAVTGSVNQLGEIQPIGGVTEKIEGFFDVCKAKGLTGDQGVVIPAQNIDNLMLKDEVMNAVKDLSFHIYAVKTIEEGIELLSGIPAGEKNKHGKYPEGSVFNLADKRLQEFNKVLSASPSKTNKESKRTKTRIEKKR